MVSVWVVVHEHVIRRVTPSKDAKIVGVERKGIEVSGMVLEVNGVRWLKTGMATPKGDVDTYMMIDGASVGLGALLQPAKQPQPLEPAATAPSYNIGSIGEALWRAPLQELPRPKWAPRSGFASLCAGKASTGRRMLWVLGGGTSDRHFTNDIWRSVDGGFAWNLLKSSRHWSPRQRFGATVGSTIPDPTSQIPGGPVQGIVYVVGGHGATGFLADVWASDTMCRTWHCMNTKAAFGPRVDVACAVVPGKPLTLVVGGGVSVDAHHDIWFSSDGGETFGPVDAPALPRGAAFRLWPPDILCAAHSQLPGQLAIWRLQLQDTSGQERAKAELLPVDQVAEEFHEIELQSMPRVPRFALDLQAQVLLSWDARQSCLAEQSLAPTDGGVGTTRILDVVATAGDAHVLCDMDSVFSSLRNGLLWVFSAEGTSLWVSGKSKLSAQDRFLGLLGLHLNMARGLPIEIWFGRVRSFLLPRRAAARDIGGVRLGGRSQTQKHVYGNATLNP
ncbi:unnamed protein product [Polarella glacialis]|uniref:Uncharacterized protein n=1 Tax=Polarella glacialis TaxID=89957 RepID=A0A813GLU6_POLGL|nr:unnamed protein product [Polarella glacialis]CAE8680322.1 unnamed protein product [Polarella glacialis]